MMMKWKNLRALPLAIGLVLLNSCTAKRFNDDFRCREDRARKLSQLQSEAITIGDPSDPYFSTHRDKVPNFSAKPTVKSLPSLTPSMWSNPKSWSTGKVPTDNEVVLIDSKSHIVYDVQSDVRIKAMLIGPEAILSFATHQNTRLKIANLQVFERGLLSIGDQCTPVGRDFTAELILLDEALDTKVDPSQYGTGLVALGGGVWISGSEKTHMVNLAVEPKAEAETLTLRKVPQHWKKGDQLVLPHTWSNLWNWQEDNDPQRIGNEVLEIKKIEGKVITLEKPLVYDHLGARDTKNKLRYLPDVGNLTRNVTVRSENPAGTRGHTLYTYRTDVDVRWASFLDLGRTRGGRLSNTTYDSNGNVVQIGTNQIGRYPFHLHHVMGLSTAAQWGLNFQTEGIVIARSRKWAIAIHQSSFGEMRKVVVYDSQQANIAFEDGAENKVKVKDSFLVGVTGKISPSGERGRVSNGIWIQSGGGDIDIEDTTIAGGILSNDGEYGTFGIHFDNLRREEVGNVDSYIPIAQEPGVDITHFHHIVGLNESYSTPQVRVVRHNSAFHYGRLTTRRCTFYGLNQAIGGDHIQSARSDYIGVFEDDVAWHSSYTFIYGGTGAFLVKNSIVMDYNSHPATAGIFQPSNGPVDYENIYVEGWGLGFWRGQGLGEKVTVSGTFKNPRNILISATTNSGIGLPLGPEDLYEVDLTDIKFENPEGYAPKSIELAWDPVTIIPAVPYVITLGKLDGREIHQRLYFNQQLPNVLIESNAVLKIRATDTVGNIWIHDGCPSPTDINAPFLTNEQCFRLHRKTTGGALPPCGPNTAIAGLIGGFGCRL